MKTTHNGKVILQVITPSITGLEEIGLNLRNVNIAGELTAKDMNGQILAVSTDEIETIGLCYALNVTMYLMEYTRGTTNVALESGCRQHET